MTKAIRQPTEAMRHFIKVDRYTASATEKVLNDDFKESDFYLKIFGAYFDPCDEGAIWNGSRVEINIWIHDSPTISLGRMNSMSLKPNDTHEGFCIISPKAHGYMRELLFAGQGKVLVYTGTKINRQLHISHIQLTNDINCEE